MTAYYNEIDPQAAATLRELIRQGHIAPGDVDERSIEDVRPDELFGYTQCHFFAGIGVWSYALRQAGWPDDFPVWTGSCPCQPFSAAGKGKGFADERHLWPAFHWLISKCQPGVVFGEQVAGKDGLGWLDLVASDLEDMGYACGAVPFPAAGIGAPHIRERLYWVADADNQGLEGRKGVSERPGQRIAWPGGMAGGLADAKHAFWRSLSEYRENGHHRADARRSQAHGVAGTCGEVCHPNPTNGFWADADWLGCRDDRWRPVEPGTFPLAHGAADRVGRLRGYGNAIVAPAAQAFIKSYIEVRWGTHALHMETTHE